MNTQHLIYVAISHVASGGLSDMMSTSILGECWSGWFAATGTFVVALLAIWGNWFRSELAGPKLKLVQKLRKGILTDTQGGGRVIYHQLVVVNRRPWSPARNCHVLIRRIERRGPNHRYHEVLVPTPIQLQWCFPSANPLLPTIVKDKPIDFVRLLENSTELGAVPCLYILPLNFDGFVRAGDCVRYHLDIISDQFVSKKLQVFEVAWDGNWTRDMGDMEEHLTVTEVTEND